MFVAFPERAKMRDNREYYLIIDHVWNLCSIDVKFYWRKPTGNAQYNVLWILWYGSRQIYLQETLLHIDVKPNRVVNIP